MNFVRFMLTVSFVTVITACGADHEAQASEASSSETSSADKVSLSPLNAAASNSTGAQLSGDVKTQILSKFKAFRPDLTFQSLRATAFPGLYEAEFEQGGIVYISESGEFFITGEIFKFENNEVVNLSEEGRIKRRQVALKSLDRKEMVTFPAEGDDVTDIYVFTDVHCGYCAKLHDDVDELAKLGVRVNYLAFPRGGSRSRAYPIMQSVWCSDDRQKAMTDAKAGKSIPPVSCDSSAVQDQFELGSRVGVNATPAIMFEDGSLELGYKPPAQLAAIAKSKS